MPKNGNGRGPETSRFFPILMIVFSSRFILFEHLQIYNQQTNNINQNQTDS